MIATLVPVIVSRSTSSAPCPAYVAAYSTSTGDLPETVSYPLRVYQCEEESSVNHLPPVQYPTPLVPAL